MSMVPAPPLLSWCPRAYSPFSIVDAHAAFGTGMSVKGDGVPVREDGGSHLVISDDHTPSSSHITLEDHHGCRGGVERASFYS